MDKETITIVTSAVRRARKGNQRRLDSIELDSIELFPGEKERCENMAADLDKIESLVQSDSLQSGS